MTTKGRKPKIKQEDIQALNDDEYFTINELANLLKVNRRTISRQIKSGQIKPLKIGGQYRIKKSDFIK